MTASSPTETLEQAIRSLAQQAKETDCTHVPQVFKDECFRCWEDFARSVAHLTLERAIAAIPDFRSAEIIRRLAEEEIGR